MSTDTRGAPQGRAGFSVLDMTAAQARDFLLKPESYCNFELPPYIRFGPLLAAVAEQVLGKNLREMSRNPRVHERVNYPLLTNKDGRYAWRPLQLIHPALYVSLVDKITSTANWKLIQDRFRHFQGAEQLECLSIPLQSSSKHKDKAAQIHNWWQGIEQRSVELALEYNHLFHADITDCYAAIYTHSIAWALHGRDEAKRKRNDKELVGNVIDAHIQDMRQGQTNGIPQGSVLMDLMSEMVMGYADIDLTTSIAKDKITEYSILRYRDDYRIFVNDPQHGEKILKVLTEVLFGLGMKLNTAKTGGSAQVVLSSIKADKRSWLRGRQWDRNLQKHLLIIHAHAQDFPNSGSVVTALARFHRRVNKVKTFWNARALISIAVDIARGSPRAFPVCAAIISKFLTAIDDQIERVEIIENTRAKMAQMPNTAHMEIWLQRIGHPVDPSLEYAETLCKLVKGQPAELWNNSWITGGALRAALDPSAIVDRRKLSAAKPVITPRELELFPEEGYE